MEVEWLSVTGSQVKPDRLQGLVNDCYHVKHPVKLQLGLDLSVRESSEDLVLWKPSKLKTSLGEQGSCATQVEQTGDFLGPRELPHRLSGGEAMVDCGNMAKWQVIASDFLSWSKC